MFYMQIIQIHTKTYKAMFSHSSMDLLTGKLPNNTQLLQILQKQNY